MQTFYMMSGLPGSGKSFAASGLPDTVIHSSDAIRAEILGDESIQDKQDLVFQTLHNRVLQDLSNGKNVVYDATNINYKRRMEFLQNVKALRIPELQTVCVFMATPYEECLERNKNRGRFVPVSVIRRMYEKFDIPMICEGWDSIWIKDSGYLYPKVHDTINWLCMIGHDNPHHTLSIGQHCVAAQMYLKKHYPDADFVLNQATLLHDIGKETTKVFHDSNGNPTEIAHYYHHERVGAYDSFAYTTNMSNKDRLRTALLIRWHMWPFVVAKSDSPAKTENKIKRLVGEDIWRQIMTLHDCDLHAH